MICGKELVSETASVVLVFVICTYIYRCLFVSVSPLVIYYQHARQRFALTFELTALYIKHAFRYSILRRR